MTRHSLLLAAGIVALGAGRAGAQEPDQQVDTAGVDVDATAYQEDPNAPPEPYGPPPIPPDVEAAPVAGAGGSVCFVGPHPVDTQVAGGAAWDDTQGAHYHFYAPFDLRLFRLENGCYYFIGDPSDFGYQGQVYSYYGAHPILSDYGGGWCFMIGGHSHWWRPWSSNFIVSGSWYYWNGPYDAYFWSYWPYYSYYYKAYYPHYYGGGRWYRGYGHHAAPRIERVPSAYARGWKGPSYVGPAPGGGWRGGGGARGTVQPTPVRAVSPRYRAPVGNWSGSGGWQGSPAPASPRPTVNAPAPAASRPAGGWSGGGWGGGASVAPSRPVAAPHPTVTPHQAPPAPPPPSRMPSAPAQSGGFHGGGSAPSHHGDTGARHF
jgi:hypothetical protein